MAIITIITIIIVCVRKKRKKNPPIPNPPSPTVDHLSINTSSVSINKEKILIRTHNDFQSHSDNKAKITITTTNQYKIKISIDPQKTMEELVKSYFQIIKRPELYGDKNIRFLLNGKFIPQDSQELISENIGGENSDVILIDDVEDQIAPSSTK